MYRPSPEEQTEVHWQITNLLQKQLIEPSTSSHGSPILSVKKYSGELRMVVNHRALDKLTLKNRIFA